jgi:hypothetical protein
MVTVCLPFSILTALNELKRIIGIKTTLITQFGVACGWRGLFGEASRFVAAKRKAPAFHIQHDQPIQGLIEYS